jgi:LEA14-like dessication related protein
MNKTILLYFVAFILCLVSCKNFKEVQCTGVKGFKVGKISTAGLDADIMLGIKNPNSFGFSIYKSEFDISYGGIYLGKAKLSKRVHIGANAEQTYSFNLKSDFKNINLADVMSLLSGASRKGMLEVKGDLKAGKLFVKKKFPVDVKERIGMN